MKYFKEALFTTVFTLLLLTFLIRIPLGTLLVPIEKMIDDFDLTDVVFSKMRDNNNHDKRITLVNIGYLDRAHIAQQIEIINQYNPKVIGIDAIFRFASEPYGDSVLSDALQKVNHLVLVNELHKNKNSGKYDSIVNSHPVFLRNANTGFADISGEVNETFATTRYCIPEIRIKDSIALSFTTLISSFYDLHAANNYLARNNENEIINFQSSRDVRNEDQLLSESEIVAIDCDQLLSGEFDGESMIKDKIVLMGFMGRDFQDPINLDKYFTPVNKNYIGKAYPDMFGVAIHANIISMILNNSYINKMPVEINIAISVLLIFLNVWLLTYCYHTFCDNYESISTLIIFSEVLILILIILIAFEYENYKLSVFTTIVGFLMSGYSVKLYQGIVPIFYNYYRRKFYKQAIPKEISFSE